MKNLKLENLIPGKDGLIILERGLALKMSTGEENSANQETTDKCPLTIKKITEGLPWWS